ncbi:YeeE/YedE family protein [Sediminitomix flava]|uniref:Uncharacterized protein n=1 Tax=Sediminitomix flava TaxID=379075 RepID=A0A316A256_SEDFL|nr:YeeE/YedE thiosulfate transporter family protein [Sediminitomix flava]PWJ43777.1 hypothetical protein BC781_101123 [Sediminitomix flava]
MEVLSQQWPWYVSGPLITLVMAMLLFGGKTFGVSSNLRVLCSACGAGKKVDFFRFEWKNQLWNLLFVLGAMIGGFIASNYLNGDITPQLNENTVQYFSELRLSTTDMGLLPQELFSLESMMSLKGMAFLIIGGFFVGFGSRYAGGCTSGHAISGLSNLQLPSLIAVVGFFIGGLVMTHLILPFIL